MTQSTPIEWTDLSWNPVRGCARVSEGCRNCYAETMANRFKGEGQPYEGLIKTTSRGPQWNGKARFVPHMLADPIKLRKPSRIFVNSMSDLFHNDIEFTEIASVFGVMAATPRHTYQVLTKRPERMLEFFAWLDELDSRCTPPKSYLDHIYVEMCSSVVGAEDTNSERARQRKRLKALRSTVMTREWPLSNVWLGVSVEDQDTADERIPLLAQAPAHVRWISAEPLLGPVTLPLIEDLDWVVVGGESGKRARNMDVSWTRSLRDQCASRHLPFLFKQWGRFDGEGREVGKKKSGRLLDGKTWHQFPVTVTLDLGEVA